jgi:hypothetical protein
MTKNMRRAVHKTADEMKGTREIDLGGDEEKETRGDENK